MHWASNVIGEFMHLSLRRRQNGLVDTRIVGGVASVRRGVRPAEFQSARKISAPARGAVAKGASAAARAFRRVLVFWVVLDDSITTVAQQEGHAIETIGPRPW